MKLHLPISLRRAIVALLSALPVSTVAVTVGSASVQAQGSDLTPVIRPLVSEWNNDQAEAAYKAAYTEGYNTAYSNAYDAADEAYQTAYNAELARLGEIEREAKEQSDETIKLATTNGTTKYHTEIAKFNWQETHDDQLAAIEADIYLGIAKTWCVNKLGWIVGGALSTALDALNAAGLVTTEGISAKLKERFTPEEVAELERSAHEEAKKQAKTYADNKKENAIAAAKKAAEDEYNNTITKAGQDAYDAAILNSDNIATAEAAGNAKRNEAGVAAGIAAGKEAGEKALADAHYIYSEQYGSTAEYTPAEGEVGAAASTHTNCNNLTNIKTETDSEKVDLHQKATSDGNLVLDKESFYTLTVEESDANKVNKTENSTDEHNHNYIKDAAVTLNLIDYVLGETEDSAIRDLGEGSLITKHAANSITIGSEHKAELKAASVDMDALSNITVQEGSSITSTVGNVALNSELGNVSVLGGSSITGKTGVELTGNQVEVNASTVTATTGNATLTGGSVTLDQNATVIASEGTAKLEATNGNVAVKGSSGIEAKNVELTGTQVEVNAATITATNGDATLTGGSVTLNQNATVIASKGTATLQATNGGVDIRNASAILAEDVNLSASGAVSLAGGSTVTATDGGVSLEGGSISVEGASGIMGESVELNSTGDISFAGGSGVNAGSIGMSGNKVSLNGAQFSSTGAAIAPNLDGDSAGDAAAQGEVAPDVLISGKESVELTNGTQVGGNNVKLSSEGTLTLKDSTVSANRSVTLTGAAVKLDGSNVLMSGSKGTVALNGTDSLELTDSAKIDVDAYVDLTGGDITVQNGAIVKSTAGQRGGEENAEYAVVLNGEDILLTGVESTIAATRGGGVLMNATGDITVRDSGKISVTSGGSNPHAKISMKGKNVKLDGARIGASGKGSLGLSADESITVTGGSNINVNQGISAMAKNISFTGDIQHFRSDEGAITLNATDKLTLESDSRIYINGAEGVTLGGKTVNVSGKGTRVESTNGDIELNATGTNTIQNGASVTAKNGAVTMNGTLVTASIANIGSLLSSTFVETNTVSGATVSAGGAFSMTGTQLKYEDNIYTTGSNTLTDGATITAGSVALNGLMNTISGKYEEQTDADGNKVNALTQWTKVTGDGDVEIGVDGMTLTNTINGADVISTGGDIVLNAQLNTIGADSMLTSTSGSIMVNGSAALGIQTLISEVGDIPYIGSGIVDWIMGMLPEGVDFNLTMNNVNGSLHAFDSVQLKSTLNLVSGGSVSAGNAVDFNGAANIVTSGTISGDSVKFWASPDNTLNLGDIITSLGDSLGGLLGGNNQEGEEGEGGEGNGNQMDIAGLIQSLGAALSGNLNLVMGEGSLVEAGQNVDMLGTANALINTEVQAGGLLTMSGAPTVGEDGTTTPGSSMINLVTGSTLNTGSAAMNGTLNALVDSSLTTTAGDITMTAAGDSSNLVTALLNSGIIKTEDLEKMGITQDILNSVTELLTGGANVLYGSGLDGAGNVTMAGTANALIETTGKTAGVLTMTGTPTVGEDGTSAMANVLYNSTLSAGSAALNGTVNALVGSSLSSTAGSINLTAAGDASNLVTALLNSGIITEETLEDLGITQETLTEVAKLLTGGVNVLYGSSLNAKDVTLNGTANVLTNGGALNGSNVTLNGLANVVMGGTKVNGSNILLQGSGNTLQLGTLVGAALNSNLLNGVTLPEGTEEALVSALNGVNGSVNLVYGGSTDVGNSGSASVTMDALANIVAKNAGVQGKEVTLKGLGNVVTLGATVGDAYTNTVTMDGVANVVYGGTVSGNSITMGMSAGNGYNVLPVADILTALSNIQGLEVLKGLTQYADILSSLPGINANVVYGQGSAVGTTTSAVTLNGTANLVGNGAVVNGAVVTMNGLGNVVLEGGKVNGTTTTLDGLANVVYGGTVTGNTVNMGLTSANPYGGMLSLSNLLNLLPDTVGEYDITAIKQALSGVTMNTPNANLVMGDSAMVGGWDTSAVTLNGTANVVTHGAKVIGSTVTLNGMANVVMGGAKVYGTNILLQGNGDTLSLGSMAGALLGSDLLSGVTLPEGTADMVISLLDSLNSSVNLVYGGSTDVGISGSSSVTLNALANIVAKNAGVQGLEVNMSGLANVVAAGATVGDDYTNTVNMDGLANVLYGGTVTGNTVNMGLTSANPYDGDLSVNTLLKLIPDEVSGYDITAIKNALSGMTLSAPNANLILDGSAVTADSNVNLNGTLNLVAGGAQVTAGETVNMNGLANVVVDTTMQSIGDALTSGSLGSITEGGDAPTVIGGKNIVMDALTNVMLGDKVMVKATQNVTLSGTANVIGFSAQVSGNNVTLKGQNKHDTDLSSFLPAGLVDLAGKLGVADILQYGDPNLNVVTNGAQLNATNKLELNATANVVMGGADLKAGTISLTSGGVNVVADTTLQNFADAIQSGSLAPIVAGGKDVTTLTATNINLSAAANIVNGGKVMLDATEAVTMNGLVNVLSGNARVEGNNVTLTGNGGARINWSSLLPAEYSQLANLLNKDLNVNLVTNGAKVTADDRLHMNATANVVMGGAELNAKSIDLVSGGVNVVADTTLQNFADAIQSGSLAPIVAGGKDNTTLTAGNINLTASANIVNGGKVVLDATETVTMNGLANVISGNAQVSGKNVNMLDYNGKSIDWSSLLPEEYSQLADILGTKLNVNVVSNGASVTADDRLHMNATANVVMGGAELNAKSIDLVSGGVNMVVDTTLQNFADAIQNGSLDSLMAGGSETTKLTADHINLNAAANVVNGKVALDADKTVAITGAANMVGGNAQVEAADVTLTGTESAAMQKLVDVLPGEYGQMVEDLGVMELGSANVVMSGADVKAGNDVKMSGGLNVVTDATLADVMSLVDQDDTTQPGGGVETTVHAGNNVTMDGLANVVMGNKAQVSADNKVTLTGTASVVTAHATVKAGKDIELSSSLNLVSDGATLTAEEGSIVMQSAALDNNVLSKLADKFLTSESDLVNMLTQGNANVVMGASTSLNAAERITMDGVANVVMDGAELNAGSIVMQGEGAGTLALDSMLPESVKNVVTELGAGSLLSQPLAATVMTGEGTKLNATTGDIQLNSAANVLNGGASLVAGNDVKFNGKLNVLEDTTVEAGRDIVFSGASVMTNADLTAENGQVRINNAMMNGGNIVAGNGLSIQTSTVTADSALLSGTSTIAAGSVASINDMVCTSGTLYNGGSLEMVDVSFSSADVVNAGNMTVNGQLSMLETALTFYVGTKELVDGGHLTGNAATISLGTGASLVLGGATTMTMAASSLDAITGVNFVVTVDELVNGEYTFSLDLFEMVDGSLATTFSTADWESAIKAGEVTFTLVDAAGQVLGHGTTTSVEVLTNGSTVTLNGRMTIPEPTTATLSLLALVGLAARRRRK